MMNAPSEHSTATTTIAQDTAVFHGVRYLVTDVKRAIDFYTKHLGFNLEHQQLPMFATVALGPLKIHLSGPGASGSRPLPGGERQSSRRLKPRRSSSERPARNHRSTAQRRSGVSEHHGNRTSRQADPGPRSRRQSSRAFRAGASGLKCRAA